MSFAAWKQMLSARRSDTYKVLSQYNSVGLSRRRVLRLTVAILESECNARTFGPEKSATGKNRQPLLRAAKKLAKKDHAEILEWFNSYDPFAEEIPGGIRDEVLDRALPFAAAIRDEVVDHIRRAGGEGLGSPRAVKRALTAIGNGKPVPLPSPEAIAALAHAGATPFLSKRYGGPEVNVEAADLVLKLASWFWLLTAKCPTYSNTEPELIRGGFQVFMVDWVEAGGDVGERQWRRDTASLYRIREAVKYCQRRRCESRDACRVDPRCAKIESCKRAVPPIGLTWR